MEQGRERGCFVSQEEGVCSVRSRREEYCSERDEGYCHITTWHELLLFTCPSKYKALNSRGVVGFYSVALLVVAGPQSSNILPSFPYYPVPYFGSLSDAGCCPFSFNLLLPLAICSSLSFYISHSSLIPTPNPTQPPLCLYPLILSLLPSPCHSVSLSSLSVGRANSSSPNSSLLFFSISTDSDRISPLPLC